MPTIIKKNYKTILMIGLIILLIPLVPIMIEIIFKLGNYVGTLIRMIGTNGMCV